MITKAQNLPCLGNNEVCFSFSAVRLWGYFLPDFSLQDAHTHTYTHIYTHTYTHTHTYTYTYTHTHRFSSYISFFNTSGYNNKCRCLLPLVNILLCF